MKRLLSLLVASALVLVGTSAFAAVASTPHNFDAVASRGQCEVCHVPHGATAGAARLWRKSPFTVAGTVWGATPVAQLCATCHGGGAADMAGIQNNAADPASDQSAAAFADASHQMVDTNLAALETAGTGADLKCTTCHNVHDNTVEPFLRSAVADSAFCVTCHDTRTGSGDHTIGVDLTNQATRIFNGGLGLAGNPVGTGSWPVGAKFDNGGVIGCSSCHSVHSRAQASPFNGAALTAFAACTDCHTDGAGGTVGVGADHPINGLGTAPGNMMTFTATNVLMVAGFTHTANQGPNCTDCHDIHAGSGAAIKVTGFACDACHDMDVTKHHSNTANTPGSALTCGTCHGGAEGSASTAHNGFMFAALDGNTDDNAVCGRCHSLTNPTVGLDDTRALSGPGGPSTKDFSGGFITLPADHLTANRNGSATHFMGLINGSAQMTGGYASIAGTKWGSGSNVVCLSCHNFFTTAGPSENLLIGTNYIDDDTATTSDGQAVGSGFCTQCHAPTSMHPMTGSNVDDMGATGGAQHALDVTGASGIADVNTAGLPYAGASADGMDCDTCHKPHAANGGDYDNTADGTRPAITELTITNTEYAGFCKNCHTR